MSGLMRPIKAEQRSVIKKFFHVAESSGTLSLDVGATDGKITDGGVGDFTITFTEPFERIMGVTVTVEEADCIAYVESISATAVTVILTNADGSTAEDASCYLEVTGSLSADET